MRLSRPWVAAAGSLAVLSLALSVPAQTAGAEDSASGDVTSIEMTGPGLSVAVRDLGPSADSDGSTRRVPRRVNPLADEPNHGARGTRNRGDVPEDPLIRGVRTASRQGRTPEATTVFDGTANPEGCGTCSPPDPTGDVGGDYYVQMVNATKVAIYNKSGVLQTPAFDLSSLFSSGSCSAADVGDPQIVYDSLADRWLFSEFYANGFCIALSQTSDPLGSFYTYEVATTEFPDYFKIGVWPTGYYIGSNESTDATYALDRTSMLAGVSATAVRIGSADDNFMMPADVDGTTAPEDQGGVFYTFLDAAFHGVASDMIRVSQFTPDFDTPANSALAVVASLDVTAFTYTVCGYFNFNCVSQSGTTRKIDVVSEWPMQRFAYMRFADHESLVGNFTVGGGTGEAGSAIRWFELRNTGAGWTLYQEGTQDEGDGLDRFMGSIAMDGNGNIALGYSASSSTEFPSLRYATRSEDDTLGTLQSEQIMQAGAGSQTGSNRWGDYSAMSVDPTNEVDFWYTGEYYGSNSSSQWDTAIGTFTVPESGDDPIDQDPIAQTPAGGCVTAPGRIPKRGARKLAKANCVTNAGQDVGVKVTAKRIGASAKTRNFRLFCKLGNGDKVATKATGYGPGSRYCENGALVIRTFGRKLRLRVRWAAPVIGDYTAYLKARTYRT